MIEKTEWQQQALALAKTKTMSWREIADMLKVSKSTVSDFLRKYEDLRKDPDTTVVPEFVENTHLVIPDSQVRPGIDLDYLRWIGEYIVRKRPNVVIHLGDFADMESLSSYDKGKRTAEGKRVQADIDVAKDAMEELLTPLWNLQHTQATAGEKIYEPRLVLTLGNHEDRITRHVNANPELHGFLSIDSLEYEQYGWEVYPFLTPVIIDGIAYCHYWPNVMTGKAMGGSAAHMLKTIGRSFTQGHRQTLDITTRFLPGDGKQQWGVIAGACYEHEEEYKGVQGNHHWRGIIVKHNVKNGSYDPLLVSLDWLKKEYK